MPSLVTVPGLCSVLGYTIAAEIGNLARFASPTKLTGCSALCPHVYQPGESDQSRSATCSLRRGVEGNNLYGR